MCQTNLFNLLTDNPTTGGSWTQVINSGNSTIPIVNGIIDTTGALSGEYTFNYTVDNGYCSDVSIININVFNSIDDITIYVCTNETSSNIFNELVDAYLLQYNTNLIVDNSEWVLSYASGSPTSASIELSTGDFDPSMLTLSAQYNLLLTLTDSVGYCDCIAAITLEAIGCSSIVLSISDECLATYTADCSTLPIDRVVLQVDNNGTWDIVSTTLPYTITTQIEETYRIEIRYLISYPFGDYYCYSYSNEVTHACVATLCEDCTLVLETVNQYLVGILACGDLSSPTCVVGNYVIDWYLDTVSPATLQYTTGNSTNTDPDIEVFHPFTGNSSIPTVGGVYIPKLRYVELDGILYSYNNYPASIDSPDLENCLTTIEVINPSCTNGSNPTQGYNYNVGYQANTNFNNAARTIIYEYDTTTAFIAYSVTGYSISDRYTFIHVDNNNIETTLEDVVVGNDVPTTSFTGIPKLVKSSSFVKGIIDVPSYVAGSYIKIIVAPSYYNQSNQNTSWLLRLQCLDEYLCNCQLITSYTPGVINTTCTILPCAEQINISIINPCDFNYIGSTQDVSASVGSYNSSYLCTTTGGTFLCKQINGTVTTTKTSNVITVQYTDNAEYLVMKNYWLSVAVSLQCVDNTIYSYYNSISINIVTGTSCGDLNQVKYLRVHHCNTPTFNDSTNTITISLSQVTNNYVDVNSCDVCANYVNTSVTAINNSFNEPDFSVTTSVSDTYILRPFVIVTAPYPQVLTVDRVFKILYYAPLIASSILSCSIFSCSVLTVASQISRLNLLSYRVELTNTSAPCGNFRILIKPLTAGGCVNLSAPYNLFYELQNGVQIFP